MKPETVLITGASSGIGYALAERFAAGGFRLILVARDKQRLDDAAKRLRDGGAEVELTVSLDLAKPDAVAKLQKAVGRRQVDVLINNAGFGGRGLFAVEQKPEEINEMIAVNVAALTSLTRLFLPGMIERKHGRILNIASTAAFLPGPLMSVYYATKAYVLSFSEAMASELGATGVTVTCLCPGPTETGFAMRARVSGSRLFRHRMDVAKVADAGFKATLKGKRVVIPGLRSKLTVWGAKLSGRKAAAEAAKGVHLR